MAGSCSFPSKSSLQIPPYPLVRKSGSTSVLVDTNVILDISTNDNRWYAWSAAAMEQAADESTLVINPIIYAEVSIAYKKIEDIELALPPGTFRRAALPYEAAFLAGKAFLRYKQRGG